MYKAQVNGKSFEIQEGEKGLVVNGDQFTWDLTSLGNGHYHIVYKNKSYQAEVVRIDKEARAVELKLQNLRYTVQLKDKFDLLLEKMGMNVTAGAKVNVIKAPMPGLIVDLRVKAGDVVKAGDPILVLEAMKMENIIKAPGDGTIKLLKIKKGDTVEKNQVLIEL